MDFNIEIRKKQLESLDQFVNSSRDKLQSVMDFLGWSVDKIEEERLMVNCPYNATHTVPAEKIEDHVKLCAVKTAGYKLDENFLSEPTNQTPEGSIKLDTVKKIEVLSYAITQTPYFQTAWNGQDPDPQTYSRYVTTFSRDERLALYNYCVSNTKGPQALPEFNTSATDKEDENNVYTTKALRSFERDLKRRSVKYKPIHTNHKNYKEVLREVINSQMQQYSDWVSSSSSVKGPRTPEYKCGEETDLKLEEHNSHDKISDNTDRPHSSISRNSNNSSSSHSTAKRRERSSRSSRYYSRDHKSGYYRKEYNSRHSRHRSRSKQRHTAHYEDDSQDSYCFSKTSVKTEVSDSPNELSDYISRNHSRESSLYSSKEYKHKGDNYKETTTHKSKSPSSERKIKRYRHRSRSRHRSRERRSKRTSFRK